MRNRLALFGALAALALPSMGGRSIEIRGRTDDGPTDFNYRPPDSGGAASYPKRSGRTVAQDKRDARKRRNRRQP